MFYFSLDPIKGRFFLVLGLLFVAPVFSYGVYNWYAYYVCLIFLRGVFVILVYFSRLSRFLFIKKGFAGLCIRFVFLVGWWGVEEVSGIGLSEFYSSFFFFCFGYVIFVLFFFMNFISYFIGMGVAMRKMWGWSLLGMSCLQQGGWWPF